MNFNAGLTDAINAESTRRYQDAAAQEMYARQQRLAAEEARVAQEHRNRQEDLARDRQAGLNSIKTLMQMQPGATPPGQIGPPPGPQPPMPGQASVPMMDPMTSMQEGGAPPMGAGPQPMPPGMDSNAPMPPGADGAVPPPPPPAAVSPSWQASGTASPELGGAPPPMPAPGAIASPPSAPQLPKQLPPQWLSVPNAVAAMDKAGIPVEQQYQTLSKLMPVIEKQNQQAVTDLKMNIYVAAEMRKAQDQAMRDFKAMHPEMGTTAAIRTAAYAANPANPGADAISAQQRTKAMPTRSQAQAAGDIPAFAPPKAAAGRGGGGAAAPSPSGLTDSAVDVAAAEYLTSGKLPPMYKDNATRQKIMNRAGELNAAAGGDPRNVPADRATFKADAASLGQQQKRVDAVDASMKKIEKDIVTLEGVMDKGGSWTGAQFANVPINALRRQFNDPGLAKFDLAAKQVGTEYERMLNGGLLSVAQLHEGAREDAKSIINGDMPPDLIRAKLPVMRQEMQNAHAAHYEQLGQIRTRMRGGREDSAPAAKPAAASPGRTGEGPMAGPAEFKTEAEASAAERAGTLKKGTKVKIGGVAGTWQ